MIKRTLTAFAVVAIAATAAQATVVDLTTADSGSIRGALFYETSTQPTGTGYIDPFLREQTSGSGGIEQGYNTSGGTPFDDKAGIFTHDITLADLNSTVTTINGTQYYTILLDVNEPTGSKSLISLDSLILYTSTQCSLTTTDISQLGIVRYSLDSNGQDNTVLIDASRNHGSGSGDVYIYIPVANFAGASPTDCVYLYAQFGGADSSDGGFEEFALVRNLTPVPEMNALFPIVGLLAAVLSTRFLRRRAQARIAA